MSLFDQIRKKAGVAKAPSAFDKIKENMAVKKKAAEDVKVAKAEADANTGFAPSEATDEELASHMKIQKKAADTAVAAEKKAVLQEKLTTGGLAGLFGGSKGGTLFSKMSVKPKSPISPSTIGTAPQASMSPTLSTIVKGSSTLGKPTSILGKKKSGLLSGALKF